MLVGYLLSTCYIFPSRGYLKGNLAFVHLNLCIALLLGNLVFVSGIDAASNNRVSYEVSKMLCSCSLSTVVLHSRD